MTADIAAGVAGRHPDHTLAVDDFDSTGEMMINQPLEREVVIENIRYKAFVYGRKASMTTKLNI